MPETTMPEVTMREMAMRHHVDEESAIEEEGGM